MKHDGNTQKLVTYQGASADRKAGCCLSDRAVSSREDSVGVEECSTTEVASTALERDDEGEFASAGG